MIAFPLDNMLVTLTLLWLQVKWGNRTYHE